MHEHNPMLGHRGCRLGISFPEIYEMQCRAIFEALIECKNKKYKSIIPEIMIPLVSTEAEIKIMKDLVIRVANKVQKENKIKIDNQEIKEILTVNGVRFSFNDGSWGLIRASSNKPSLVIVTESPTSDLRKKKIFEFIDTLLQKTGKIGEYDQKI